MRCTSSDLITEHPRLESAPEHRSEPSCPELHSRPIRNLFTNSVSAWALDPPASGRSLCFILTGLAEAHKVGRHDRIRRLRLYAEPAKGPPVSLGFGRHDIVGGQKVDLIPARRQECRKATKRRSARKRAGRRDEAREAERQPDERTSAVDRPQ